MVSLRSKLLIAFATGIGVAVYALLFFDGSAQFYRFWYYSPAAVVAGAFMVDRFNQGNRGKSALALDLLIGICCLIRPIFSFPPFSGHAVFSVYVLLTCSFWSTRFLGGTLLGITLYAKLVLWKGDPTLIPGLWGGLGSGIAF